MRTLPIELLDTYAGPREYPLSPAYLNDVGRDLYAAEDHQILPGQTVPVATGIRVAVPVGYEMQIRPRSGRALRDGLAVLNTPATIDPDYRGEVKVLLHNTRPSVPASILLNWARGEYKKKGELERELKRYIESNTIRIQAGERIAQAVFARFFSPEIEVVQTLPAPMARGEAGFGSSGTAEMNPQEVMQAVQEALKREALTHSPHTPRNIEL